MGNDVLFEIGLEELPARYIDDSENMIKKNTLQWLDELRITYSDVQSFSTPRRLAVFIKDIANVQSAITEEVKGPQLKIAKDTEGNWTKAAMGFTKGQGFSTDDIYVKKVKDVPYIFIQKNITGEATTELLPSFQKVIEGLSFPKTMRWGKESLRYARPIRWLVGLYDTEVISFEVAGVKSGNKTYGHRFLGNEIILDKPADYSRKLKENFVIVSPEERRALILAGIESVEKHKNFHVIQNKDLLDEVCNLVEYPTVFSGKYKDEFLQLPREVLTASMIEHQRYFPVEDVKGNLAPFFIGVRNGDDRSLDTVIQGNEKVLHARLQDARFFYEEDQKHTLEHYQDKLEYVVFQEKLGTMKDKTKRMSKLINQFVNVLKVDTVSTEKALRAAELCKFDLTSDMVNEFTELQGVIGEIYAVHYGEDAEVALAIKEHYLPVHANGHLPQTEAGALVSISDKLDTIVGCIGVGLTPTGSQDPYGLRRKALGILNIAISRKWDIDIERLLEITIDMYGQEAIEGLKTEGLMDEIEAFFKLRASYILRELNIEPDIIEAVLHEKIGNPAYTIEKAKILSSKRQDSAFKTVHEALLRVLHLADESDVTDIDPALFETESEKNLLQAYEEAYNAFLHSNNQKNAEAALESLESLAEPIHTFFDQNMVMTENKEVRKNRLALIHQIAMFVQQYADLSTIEWKQHF